MKARTKTVTRRDPNTWKNLKPGDRLIAIEKGMGLAKGEKQKQLGVIEIVDVRVEPLGLACQEPPTLEGFESFAGFVHAWEEMHRWDDDQPVRRIEFRHVATLTEQETGQ